ncbi:hypothetical protein T484DRAFT_1765123 [Baffinella frigidus]|nr:hypothetical protein T484DRAFT_1765123 [Cryptophyta sp. CCMP2293]
MSHAGSSAVQFAAREMQKDGLPLFGVLNGTDPLQIVVPEFTVRDFTQSSPLAGYPNVVTMALVASVDLQIAAGSSITVTGLVGAVAGNNVTLTVKKDGVEVVMFCVFADGTLTLPLCNTLEASAAYTIQVAITNPDAAQDSPVVRMAASGTAAFTAAPVTKTGAVLLGVPAGADPLLVILPGFTEKTLTQSSVLAGTRNKITAALQTNVDLLGASKITLCCFDNAVSVDSSNRVGLRVLGAASTLPRFCPASNLTAQSVDIGEWVPNTFEISFTLCDGVENKVAAFELITISFNITNPTARQTAPTIAISASGTFLVSGTAVDVTGDSLLGVPNGKDPLQVEVPKFHQGALEQSSPFSDAANVISLSFAPTVDLEGNRGAVITITGINAGTQPSSTLALLDEAAPWFCVAGEASKAAYDNVTGTVTFTVLNPTGVDTKP